MSTDALAPPPTAPGTYTVRVIAPEEWDAKIAKGELAHYVGLDGAYRSAAGEVLNPQFTMLVVVEQDGVIIASWMALNTVHLEGVWVSPAHRGRTGIVAAKLLSGMIETLQRADIPAALTIAPSAGIATLLETAGFQAIPGTLFQLRVPVPATPLAET